MKHFFKASALALLLLGASCSKDEKDNSGEEIAKEAEAKEKEPLAVDLVANNVIIAGATKEEGVPPAPNGPISLDVSNTSKTALLNEGFEISLGSDANVVGAYVQFKSNDGTVADAYYDININDNASSANKAAKKSLTKKVKKVGLTSKVDDNITIDVDFGDVIEPGTFCYTICVYDGQGYVSAPSDVCVTVESWGGNSDIVGTWNVVKLTDTYNGMTEIEIIGEDNCYENSRYCEFSQDYVDYDECEILEFSKLILNADGTYTVDTKGIDKTLDDDSFGITSCDITYKEYDYSYKADGNWAYVAETGVLTVVEYSYTDVYKGETDTYTNEPGEGELVFDGVIELNDNKMVITEDYGDGETYIIHLEK